MDIASIIGFIAGFAFMLISMLLGAGGDIVVVGASFIDGASVMIVFGGIISSTLIAYPLPMVLSAFKAIGKTINPPKIDANDAIQKIIELSNLARKEGVLALEESANNMDDEFLKKGIMLIVDGAEPELVRSILETEMAFIETRHSSTRSVWEFISGLGPAWGMIGTLVGLILMLNDLSNADELGPKMSIAMITTLYGSIIANYLASPVANKLKVYSNEEMLLKEVLIEGMLSIQAGENPRIIEEKLKAFLSPAMRGASSTTDGAGEA